MTTVLSFLFSLNCYLKHCFNPNLNREICVHAYDAAAVFQGICLIYVYHLSSTSRNDGPCMHNCTSCEMDTVYAHFDMLSRRQDDNPLLLVTKLHTRLINRVDSFGGQISPLLLVTKLHTGP
jgi:hypothetical protein